MTDPKEAQTAASNVLPRGTDMVRRRSQQAAAKTQEVTEAAALTSPSGPAKTAAIAANTAKKAREGTTGREVRQKKQQAHKEASIAEIAQLGQRTVDTPLAAFTPGQQVDHVTARCLMKRMSAQSRDENRAIAQEAGRVVRGMLDGKRPTGASRARRMAQHNAKQATQS